MVRDLGGHVVILSVDELVDLFFKGIPEDPKHKDYQMLLAGEMPEEELLEMISDWLIFMAIDGDTLPPWKKVTHAILNRYRARYVNRKGPRLV